MRTQLFVLALLTIAATEEIKCDANNKCPEKYVCFDGTCIYRCPTYVPDYPAGCEIRTYKDRKGCERAKINCK
ncbi:unnamed protein product [Cylicocyclus nassatus]|uniref:Uncharacterized protein n=1 Tax=Cylicocyclus nassatus TaxID=53992 RepID=A0AA36M575_CYLNA|nr:unnamed protein product [Cylicocyclus nassatus]CAJ0598563.1 unnamed protein product [Cylicocyclus nassatus]